MLGAGTVEKEPSRYEKKKKTIIKNSVVSLRSSLDTAQERVSELEDWSDKSPRTLHRKTKSWKTQNSN